MNTEIRYRQILSAIILFFFAAALNASEIPRPTIQIDIPRVKKAPTLQEFIEGTPREAEKVVTGFVQREPRDGDPASETTTAYLSFDDKNLYVAFICKDDPKKIHARLSKREDFGDDDFIGVLLDTFHDHQRAYEFLVNPYGVQMDGVAREGQNDDYSWDTVWYTEGRITNDGYVVLVTLPFRSLRFLRKPVQEWGISLARRISRNSEMSFYPYLTRKVAGFANQMGHLDGVGEISPGRNMQFIPYLSMTGARSFDRSAAGGAQYRTDYEPRGGVDSKMVFRDAITLDVTVNPDFSQVESDQPQVTINQRYELFYPEKRPFFLENSDFFNTPETLFFSRRIMDPEYGARLTGKIGKWSVAGIGIDDRAAGAGLAPEGPGYGERAKIAISRVQRDFKNSSGIGVMYTGREFAGTYNRVLSVDTRWQIDKNWTFTGQAIRSFDRASDATTLQGNAYQAEINRSGRDLVFWAKYTDRAPDFRTQLGFIPRVDIRQVEQKVGYIWHPKQGKILATGPTLYYSMNWDRQGRMQDWTGNVYYEIELPGQTEFGVERTEVYELFQDIGFRQHRTHIYAETGFMRWFAFSSAYHFGTAVNYYPASGVPTAASVNLVDASLTVKPMRRLQIEESYLYDRVGTLAGEPIYNNHILRTKVNYQFTPRLSVRTIIDYNAVLTNQALTNDETTKSLTGDVLMTYMVNPGTALYVGYNDTYENLRLDPSGPNGWRRAQNPTLNTGRQFFVKISYLFRY